MNSPINPVPPVPPIKPVAPIESDGPPIKGNTEGEGKTFALGQNKPGQTSSTSSSRISPMELAGEQQGQVTQAKMKQQIVDFQNQLKSIKDKLGDTNITKNFTSDHYEALRRGLQKLSVEMESVAKQSDGEFSPPQQKEGQSFVEHISQWIDGSQSTLGNALQYLQNTDSPNVTDYLKLSYAVQRATQRGELFSSIISSTVGGVKTIMNTQLG